MTIIGEYVRASKKAKKNHFQKITQKYNLTEDESESKQSSESQSVYQEFEEEHGFHTVFQPDPEKDKLVVTVVDKGIGIKKKDRVKLFKLFGCL